MTVPAEAWPVPDVVQAPLNYRVTGDEKRVVYVPTPGAAAQLEQAATGGHRVRCRKGGGFSH